MLTNEFEFISKSTMFIQIVKKKTSDTVKKLIEAIKERYKLKDSKIHECYERLNEVSEKFFEEKCIYHSECYKEVTNVTKLRKLSVKICEVETKDENKPK